MLNALALLCLLILFDSCVPRRKLVYLQAEDEETSKADKSELIQYDKVEYRLQPNDIIDVKIRSLDEETNELFKSSADGGNMQMQAGIQAGGDIYYMTGYELNDSGFVDLPVIGYVEMKGLTIGEAKARLDSVVSDYFTQYYLRVQLGGIRYSALGEFNNPGRFVILQSQLTIFEAISNARDLTMVANRDEIVLIRQYPEGTRIHRINLLDRSIINTPLYFIQPNDVIYAEPLPQKSFGLGVSGAETISTIVSVVATSAALILSIIAIRES